MTIWDVLNQITRKSKAAPTARTVIPKVTPAMVKAAGMGPVTWAEYVALIARRDGISMAEAGRKAAKEFATVHPLECIRRARGGRL